MKTIDRTKILSLGLLTLGLGCAEKPAKPVDIKEGAGEVIVDKSNVTVKEGETVNIPVGGKDKITLKGNKTTGFSWSVKDKPDEKIAKISEGVYTQDTNPEGAMGVGGTETFEVEGITPGETKVTLIYSRPFEKDVPPAEIYTATIKVQAKK